MNKGLAIAGLAAAAGLAWVAKAAHDAASQVADNSAPEDAASDPGASPEWVQSVEAINPFAIVTNQAAKSTAGTASADANVQAFLTMIAYSEGTDRKAEPYRVCYGYKHRIDDLSDHPSITGEWKGERLPDAMCANAGFGPGCVSTAAGRYQFISSTWRAAKTALSLPDFSEDSQDQAAIWLIDKRGALDKVKAGDVQGAIKLCRAEWASLPGNGAGQPQRRLDELMSAFTGAGGVLV